MLTHESAKTYLEKLIEDIYKHLRYSEHISKARLTNPHYKIRKCQMRRMVARRQIAKRKYLA